MNLTRTLVLSLSALFVSCASGINVYQNQQFQAWEASGVAVEEKSPALGAALGLLPGGGSFYVGEYGLGVVNLLMWPLSVLWDPISGYDGAQAHNFYTTYSYVKYMQEKEIQKLDDRLLDGLIDETAHSLEVRRVERKYSP